MENKFLSNENLVLGVMIVIFSLLFVAWLNLDNHNLSNDEVMHYGFLLRTEKNEETYPPLYYRLSSLFYDRENLRSAAYINLAFYAVFIYFFFRLSRMFFTRNMSYLLVLLAATNYFIDYFSTRYLLDFPVLVLVVIFIYFFLKSDYFNDTKYSMLMIVIAVLGINIKWTFPFYVLGVFIFAFFSGEFREWNNRRALNFILFILAIVISLSFWYGQNIFSLLEGRIYLSQILRRIIPYPKLFSIGSIFYYLYSLLIINNFIFLPFFLLGIYHLVRRKDYRFLVWLAIPYLIFTLTVEKQARHMLAVVPIILFINIKGLVFLSKRTERRFRKYLYLVFIVLIIAQGIFTYYHNPVEDDRWRIQHAIDAIIQDSQQPVNLGILAWNDLYQGQRVDLGGNFQRTFQVPNYNAPPVFVEGLPELYSDSNFLIRGVIIADVLLGKHLNPEWQTNNNWLNQDACVSDGEGFIDIADYIIVKPFDGYFYPENHPDHFLGSLKNTYLVQDFGNCQRKLAESINASEEFALLEEIEVFDGSSILVYKRINI